MKTILVTGSGGFIGSHVTRRLLERGDHVIGIDNLNDYYPVAYKLENIDELKTFPNFNFIHGDITNRDLLNSLFDRHAPTHIAHLAARAGVRPSIEDPFIYEHANVLGSLAILDAAAKHGVKNIALTSSSSVYGNSVAIPFREDDSATDRPISPYAATKKASEVLAHTYHHLYGLNINIVRPFTVYGPCGRPDMAPWLFLEAALNGHKIRKFGDGNTKRDYTFIADFVHGFVNAIDRVYGYEIFNLGNSATVSLNEFLAIVSEITRRQLIIEQLPKQPGDVDLTNADITKARAMLDYNPTTSFRVGMEIFHDWFLANRFNK